MPQLLIAILLLALGWYGLKLFSRASPAAVAKMVRLGGGGLAGLTGLFLLLRGRPDLGMAGISFGLWLSGFFRLPGKGAFTPAGSGGGGRSQVRSASIEMELDHRTGLMQGRVIAGQQAGRALDTFTRPECEALYAECLRDDPDGARLLEAYMDRRFPGWGEAGEAEGNAGAAAGRGRARSVMTEDEAYEVLGLGKGASREEVVRAHRTLMKKFHPDHGGTADMAARVNAAKEVLLRRTQ